MPHRWEETDESQRSERVRLGVVGAGNIADMNVAGYLEHPLCDVVAVCDVDEDSAKAAADRWGVPKVYTDLAQHARGPRHRRRRDPHPHPPALRARARRAASRQARLGPEARDQQRRRGPQARRGRRRCRPDAADKRMLRPLPAARAGEEARQRRCDQASPTAIRIKTVVGQTDSEFQANLRPEGYGWRLDTRSPGGHLFDDMVHKFAMAIWLVDQDITSVQAVIRRRDYFFEPCVALFEYEDPALLGVMDVQYAPKMWMRSGYYGADEFFEIQGDEGMIWVTRATGEMLDLAPVVLYKGEQGDCGTTEIRDVDADWATGLQAVVSPLRGLAPGRNARQR